VRCVTVRGNIGNPESVEKLFATARDEFGRVDVVVNNAALAAVKPALEIDVDAWRRTMDVNVLAPFLAAKLAVPLMPEGGCIVNVSSLGASHYLPLYTDIGAAKGALESLTRMLAVELAPHGIRVNAVSAGAVDTRSLQRFGWRDAAIAEGARLPAGRMVAAEDVAAAIAFQRRRQRRIGRRTPPSASAHRVGAGAPCPGSSRARSAPARPGRSAGRGGSPRRHSRS
jgi:enoyl-[acyl-carrier protein] reductase III